MDADAAFWAIIDYNYPDDGTYNEMIVRTKLLCTLYLTTP